MKKLQEQAAPSGGPALWSLSPGQALSLTLGPGPRELRVTSGRVWLARQAKPGLLTEDVWLLPGQGLSLAAGEAVVLEAWPSAEFQLLVPPCAQPKVKGSGLKTWAALGAWLKPWLRPAAGGLVA